MTINIQDLGSNSKFIAYTTNETVASLQASVTTVLTSLGWTLHDDSASSSGKCYKAPIKSASTYKYMVVEITSTALICRVFEAWNASTHVGTNESYYGATAATKQIDISLTGGGYIYIFANSRYALFLSKLVSTGAWSAHTIGCTEFSLDGGEAAGTYPSFGLFTDTCANGYAQTPYGINGFTVSSSANTVTSFSGSTVGYRFLSVPRTVSGEIGDIASRMINFQIGYKYPRISLEGFYITAYGTGNLVTFTAYNPNGNLAVGVSYPSNPYTEITYSEILADYLPTGNNPATGLPYCITPHVIEMDPAIVSKYKTYRGRIFGMKFAGMGKSWNIMDVVNVNVDSELFHEASGISAQHYYLGNNIIIPA